MKNYLLRVLELSTDSGFGQDAIEWAILSGFVQLKMDGAQQDANCIMARYDDIIASYRVVLNPDSQTEPAPRAQLKAA